MTRLVSRVAFASLLALLACAERAGNAGDAAVDAPSDSGGGDAGDGPPRCDGLTGLAMPPRLCSTDAPCRDALVGLARTTLVEPITLPTRCATTVDRRAAFDDGAPMTWSLDGLLRGACVFVPPTATAATPRPLVIYLHGTGMGANAVYDASNLRAKAEAFDLAGDGRAGFVLAAHQGRNQEIPNGLPPAARHDVYFRGFEGEVANDDARSLDTLIDRLVATGLVDARRIHLIGWSNGGFFAQEYALFRARTPTPRGHRVASVAVFDAADPFAAPTETAPECAHAAPPATGVPTMIVHRACSTIGCDAAQQSALNLQPGYDVTAWAVRLSGELGAVVERITIGTDGAPSSCDASCTSVRALLSHLAWPDGVHDSSGRDYEDDMLAFFARHPLAE